MPKNGIHPAYKAATIECACGNKVETYSTHGAFTVDICSACHPFYTGKQKFVDTGGRIERFKRRYKQGKGQAPGQEAASQEAPAKEAPAKAGDEPAESAS